MPDSPIRCAWCGGGFEYLGLNGWHVILKCIDCGKETAIDIENKIESVITEYLINFKHVSPNQSLLRELLDEEVEG